MNQVDVVLDEGALNGETCFPSACAVVLGDAAKAKEQVELGIRQLMLKPEFRLEPSATKFRDEGFHHVSDNLLARNHFLSLLPKVDYEWVCATNLTVGSDDPYEMLPSQFLWVTTRILEKYKGNRVNLVFEQNQRLNNQFQAIVEAAAEVAGVPMPNVTVSIEGKENRVLAIADYCIALSSQAIGEWRKKCCKEHDLSSSYQYRNFAGVELRCSSLFAIDLRKGLSSRSSRLNDKSYYEVAGQHNENCSSFQGK
ncbi:hypothetical protein [Neomicrococcus aestuarii]|nr:hypothetical protein [Neomicrococcus aestuarii]